jgi:hypothetical protein
MMCLLEAVLNLSLKDPCRYWQRFFACLNFGKVSELSFRPICIKSSISKESYKISLARLPCLPRYLIGFLICHCPIDVVWFPWPVFSKPQSPLVLMFLPSSFLLTDFLLLGYEFLLVHAILELTVIFLTDCTIPLLWFLYLSWCFWKKLALLFFSRYHWIIFFFNTLSLLAYCPEATSWRSPRGLMEDQRPHRAEISHPIEISRPTS